MHQPFRSLAVVGLVATTVLTGVVTDPPTGASAATGAIDRSPAAASTAAGAGVSVEYTFADDPEEDVVLSGSARAGTRVRLDHDGTTLRSVEVGGDGHWETSVNAPNAPGRYSIDAVGTSDDGEYGRARTDVDYGDGVTVTSPADGDPVDTTGGVAIAGAAQERSRLKVHEEGDARLLGEGTAGPGGAYRLRTVALEDRPYVLVVEAVSKGYNHTSATVSVQPEQPPAPAPTAAVRFPRDVSQEAVVDGSGVTGATITITDEATDRVVGGPVTVVGGRWSTPIAPVGAGERRLVVAQTGAVGTQTVVTSADYGDAVALERPAEGSIAPGLIGVSGRAQDGAGVTVSAGGRSVTAAVRSGRFDAEIGVPPSREATTITVEQRSRGALRTTDHVEVTPDAPQELRPVVMTSPTAYPEHRGARVAGTATPYATVTVSTQYSTLPPVRADAAGNWEFYRGFGPDVIYTATATQVLADGRTSTSEPITFAPEGAADLHADVVITGPEDGNYEPGPGGKEVRGTAAANATLVVSSQYWSVPVKADIRGNWSFHRGFGPDTVYFVTATQTRYDGSTSTSAVFVLKPTPSQTSPVAVTGPQTGYRYPGGTRITGIASPGATVTVSSQWDTFDPVVADARGNWSLVRGFGPTEEYVLTAKQVRTDQTTSTSQRFTLGRAK